MYRVSDKIVTFLPPEDIEPEVRVPAREPGGDAIHPPARRGDAGLPPGPRRHRRQRHRHGWRDHPGRGRRRHRLRHDRGQDQVPGRPAPRRPAQAAWGDRAAHPAVRRRLQQGGPRHRHGPGEGPGRNGARALRRAHPQRLGGAARLARRRQPLHRGLHRRGRAGVDRAALGLARHRQPARAIPHQGGADADGPAADRFARPRPRLAAGERAGVPGLHGRPPLGAGVRSRQPRGDDGPGARRVFPRDVRRGRPPGARSSASGSTATTTSPRESATSAPTSGSPARARSR